MSIKSLETLTVWTKAKEFALRIYREVLPLLPPEEKWNIDQQLRRASNSIPANIAEGYGRFYYQEIIRFCYISRGSLEETLSHLAMCYELKYISKTLFDSLEQDGEKLTQLINGYVGYLKRSKQGQNEPGANHTVREDIASYETDFSEDSKDIE
ncbi:MAG TPA: four helix bundle protein [Anaerolineales bacterium]|nr:four helix bundle protein [Anaerolineales bacterium]